MIATDTIMAGKYVIVRPLESGGMGDVYDAFQKDLSRPVAIKMLRADILGDPAMFMRFRREAEAAASLGHPNIVQILDYDDRDGQPMLVMEKLEGRSLRELLADEGKLPPPRAAFIALQILSALSAAHDAKIIHRDVKPANVFIIKTFAVRDFVKILDFGVAKVLDPGGGAPVLTELGQVLGTASYMAPEQAKGLTVDGRADLFAVGGILFEAISGVRPRELGPAGLIDAGMKPCRKLAEVMPSVDRRLADAIDRALLLDRTQRFATAEAMAKALAPFAPQDLVDLGRTERTVRDAVFHAPENAVTQTGDLVDEPPKALAETVNDKPLVVSTDPMPFTPQPMPSAPPAAPARTSYQPPMYHHASIPAPAYRPSAIPVANLAPLPLRAVNRWTGLFYAVPVIIIVGLLGIGVGVFLFIGTAGNDRERDFMTTARPARCSAPATCSGRTDSLGGKFAICSPTLTGQYRAGDVVFVDGGSYSRAATFVGNMGGGRVRIKSTSGSTRDVSTSEVIGAYCAP